MPDIITIKAFTNNFLIKTEKGYLLIDTFLPNKYKRFLRKLKRLGIDVSEIKYLFLTHHHTDHVGFVAKLQENFDVKLIVHEKAVEYLEKGEMENYTKPLNFLSLVAIFSMELILGRNFPPVKLSKEDIVISEDKSTILKDLLNLDAIVLRTPGSTDDNISIVFSDGKAITGDVITNLPKILGIRNRPPLITTLDKVYQSWQLLINHNAKLLYPSHGKPFAVEVLEKHLNKFQKKAN